MSSKKQTPQTSESVVDENGVRNTDITGGILQFGKAQLSANKINFVGYDPKKKSTSSTGRQNLSGIIAGFGDTKLTTKKDINFYKSAEDCPKVEKEESTAEESVDEDEAEDEVDALEPDTDGLNCFKPSKKDKIKPKSTDFAFTVNNEPVMCINRDILRSKAPLIAQLFADGSTQVPIEKKKVKSFAEVLSFVETGKINPDVMEEYAVGILVHSDEYQLEVLKKLCEQFFLSKLCSKTAEQIEELATRCNAQNLKNKVKIYIEETVKSDEDEEDDVDSGKFW